MTIMKESIISFIYRYHFWAFQCKWLGFIVLFWPVIFVPYLLFPQKRIQYKQTYNELLDKRSVLRSNLFGKDPVGSSVRSINYYTDIFLYISYVALLYKFRAIIIDIIIIVSLYTCVFLSDLLIEKKTGFSYSFGPIYKKYFKKFINEPVWKQCLWFAFFTSLYSFIIIHLVKWSFS